MRNGTGSASQSGMINTHPSSKQVRATRADRRAAHASHVGRSRWRWSLTLAGILAVALGALWIGLGRRHSDDRATIDRNSDLPNLAEQPHLSSASGAEGPPVDLPLADATQHTVYTAASDFPMDKDQGDDSDTGVSGDLDSLDLDLTEYSPTELVLGSDLTDQLVTLPGNGSHIATEDAPTQASDGTASDASPTESDLAALRHNAATIDLTIPVTAQTQIVHYTDSGPDIEDTYNDQEINDQEIAMLFPSITEVVNDLVVEPLEQIPSMEFEDVDTEDNQDSDQHKDEYEEPHEDISQHEANDRQSSAAKRTTTPTDVAQSHMAKNDREQRADEGESEIIEDAERQTGHRQR